MSFNDIEIAQFGVSIETTSGAFPWRSSVVNYTNDVELR